MIIKQYIKEFEAMGLGIFVHFGIYSVIGKGEWIRHYPETNHCMYEATAKSFRPDINWAENLVSAAKNAGAKYITLTARHHDGYSLYDTQGISDFDSPIYIGRDLVREFVNACHSENILPFFYHTLVDWHMPEYNEDFPKYLRYLRSSVEKLCTNYGKIGGIWFDGTWDKPDADWEQDTMYSMIRKHQPNAMIINNTGLDAQGALGHIELDSVTFERGCPQPINMSCSPKYIASEMCQVMNGHWGFALNDLNYKSTATIISEFAQCRRYGANYLLNVGPMENGAIRTIDRGILEILGQWVQLNEEALRFPRPTVLTVAEDSQDFVLQNQNCLYLFVMDPPDFTRQTTIRTICGSFSEKYCQAVWLDSHESLPFRQSSDKIEIEITPSSYGTILPVRIIKLCA